MRKILFALVLNVCLIMPAAEGADIMDFLKAVPLPSVAGSSQDSNTIASGLKDALSVGTKNTVGLLSKKDGYFGNEAVKILLPESVRKVGDVLKMAGYQKEVDAFILSMNQAAEKAVPKEAKIRTNPAARTTDLLKKVFGK